MAPAFAHTTLPDVHIALPLEHLGGVGSQVGVPLMQLGASPVPQLELKVPNGEVGEAAHSGEGKFWKHFGVMPLLQENVSGAATAAKLKEQARTER